MIIIIPARGGSKRIPRKNLQVVGGKTLVRRALEMACSCGFDNLKVVLSSDSGEILEQAKDLPVLLRLRPDVAARDEATTGEVVKDAIEGLGLDWQHIEPIVVLEPTNPFLEKKDIDGAWVLARKIAPIVIATRNDRGRNGLFLANVWQWGNGAGPTWSEGVHIFAPGVDINTPEDLEEARRLWKELHGE
jgi:CMP-2-keto-3-deoxyoctulosonic acid synthetase